MPSPRGRAGVDRARLLDVVDQLGKRAGCEHAAATREDALGVFRTERRLRKAQKLFAHAFAIEGERGIPGNMGHLPLVPRRASGNAYPRRPAHRIVGEQARVRLDLDLRHQTANGRRRSGGVCCTSNAVPGPGAAAAMAYCTLVRCEARSPATTPWSIILR